jgi:hypothetical protein
MRGIPQVLTGLAPSDCPGRTVRRFLGLEETPRPLSEPSMSLEPESHGLFRHEEEL